jgi:hypothetical protein
MTMMRVWLVLSILLNFSPLAATPLAPANIPAPLETWRNWVMHDDQTWQCPFFYNRAQRQCQWPSQLEIQVDKRGGKFQQDWQIHGAGWVALPGNARHWPLDVKIDSQPAIVTDRDGTPALWLLPGQYRVSGFFRWQSLPEHLPIPAATGLVQLQVDEVAVPIPDLDNQGRLWLRQRGLGKDNEEAANRLELRAYRHILDEVPLQQTLVLALDVAGKAREVLLGPVLDSGGEAGQWTPIALDSALPARLEADGRLRVQVRPGSWEISLRARHNGASDALSRPQAGAGWPEQEVWVFEARNHLRIVEISGVTALDPQQTSLPPAWRQFPAYRVLPGETFTLNQKRRGDPDPAPNQLHLTREIWLDFDGHGYTIKDQINGSMTQGWRLEMGAPARLGRVSIDGADQLITRRAPNDPNSTGVEVRQGRIQLQADSRIDASLRELPAVGWQHEFQKLRAVLHLPPGWRLLHAEGVDGVHTTWLKQWNLLNLFLVLMTALAVAKLWNRWLGLLSLIVLVLIYHENDAPRWIFLHVLAALALLRVLPDGRWFTWVARRYRDVSLLALFVIALPFMVNQARQALYPQLEQEWLNVAQYPAQTYPAVARGGNAFAPPIEYEYDQMQQEEARSLGFNAQQAAPSSKDEIYDKLNMRPSVPPPLERKAQMKQLTQIDPNAQIQTGPGLPFWTWKSVTLEWNGPVKADQNLRLYLVPPIINSLLSTLRVVLSAVLIGFLAYMGWRRQASPPPAPEDPDFSLNASPRASLLLLALCLPLLVPLNLSAGGSLPILSAPTSNSGFPPPELLEELRQRLRASPDCLPYCAASPRLHVELKPQHLRLYQEIHAQGHTIVPLPGQAQQWLPQEVWLNGQAASGLWRDKDGRLWLDLVAGIHHLQLVGPLPSRASVQLPLPLAARTVSVESEGWRVDGVHENGIADSQLQFSRETPASTNAVAELEMGSLPPFVEVERTLLLGLEWQVETTVRRLGPAATAVVLEIPLLAGESVTSEKPRVENGRALINMATGETSVTWTSVFAKQDQIALNAPETFAWSEVWQVDTSAIWHLRSEGIAVVHHQNADGHWLPQWRPWPGESVILHLNRPAGVPGQVMTIDHSLLQVEPGKRATRNVLSLSLRSSRGGRHRLSLPDGAELQSVSIDGKAQPIRLEGRDINLPLTPGAQQVEIVFNEVHGSRLHFRTAAIDLGSPSVNAQISLKMPYDRWIFFTGGPPLGPAVLFWGMLGIALIAAIALARTGLTPLNTWQWLLLALVIGHTTYLPATLIIVAWFIALGWRGRLAVSTLTPLRFDVLQILLVLLTLLMLALLVSALQEGLLGHPDMQISGNGSSRYQMYWFQDRVDGFLPQAWVISVPLMFYRAAMLLWALWLAFALLRWLRWGWEQFSHGALWRAIPRRTRGQR